MQPDELLEKPMSPMQYARSGLGTAEMNGKLIAAGKSRMMRVTGLKMSIYIDLWHADLGQEDSICFVYFKAEIALLLNMPNFD